MNHKVTIAIPTFNRRDYLELAIEACLKQTYENLEIIVSDNCSTDDTEAFAKSIQNSKIVYFRHENPVPPLQNWNKCIELATGTYFSFLTDDDLISPRYVELLLKVITEQKDASMVRCLVQSIDSDGNILERMPDKIPEVVTIKDYVIADLHGRKWQPMGAAICSTQLLKDLGGFESVGLPGGTYTDNLLWLKVAVNGSKVITLQECLFSYRVHSGHLGIDVNLKEFADGSIGYIEKYKNVVSEAGIDSGILHYLDNQYAAFMIKGRLGVKISRMIDGNVPYHRRAVLDGLNFVKSYLRLKPFDMALVLGCSILLCNRNLARNTLKIYKYLNRQQWIK